MKLFAFLLLLFIPAMTQSNEDRKPSERRARPVAPVHLGINRTSDYHLKHGQTFHRRHNMPGRYFYSGHRHHHWTYWTFDNRYGTFLYWDKWTKNYFYWCAPHNRYYPIDHAPLGYVFPQRRFGVAPIPEPQKELPPPPPPLPTMPPASE